LPPSKLSIEVSALKNVYSLLLKVSIEMGIGYQNMQVATVWRNRITKIFKSTEKFSVENLFNQTLVVYQTFKIEPGNELQFVPVNLFDTETGLFFGIPFLIEKPDGMAYSELEEKLEKTLLRFSRQHCYQTTSFQLNKWWKESVRRGRSKLIQSNEPTTPESDVRI
jgi:hypothetical protein